MEQSSAVAIFLVQVMLLLAIGRLLGEVMQRIGQPAVMGQLVAGLLLGPSVLGAFAPSIQHALFVDNQAAKRMLDGLSELGVLLLLLLTGMESNLGAVRAMRRAALTVSLSGIAVPFACGVLLGHWMPATLLAKPELRLAASLFLGTALAISSVKVVASVVRDMEFHRRRVGRVMVSAAIVDDTLGWMIIAITTSLAMHGTVSFKAVGMTFLGIALFLVAAFTLGRRVVVATIRWANDQLTIDMPVITAIIVLTSAFALSTDLIGVHTVLGAFVAGLLVAQSPILTRQVEEQLRGVITGLFMPLFFGSAGLSADLTVLLQPQMALFAGLLVLVASGGKFIGAYVGGALGGLTLRECTALAWGMNARGSTEVIIATIGLSIGVLTRDVYTMIVAMAIVTTLIMPPALRWALRRVPMSKKEREEEERERAEATQFLPQIERVLAVVDSSEAGRLAAYLVGRLNSASPKLTAVLDVHDEEGRSNAAPGPAVEVARQAAEHSPGTGHEKKPEAAERPIEPAPAARQVPVPERVKKELEKGYDLVLFGLEGEPTSNATLAAILNAMAESYHGARAFVMARGRAMARASSCILLPVTGTDYSRRAAEIAIALAAAADSRLPVLYVSRTAARPPWYRARGIVPEEERAPIEDIRRIAGHRRVAIVPHIRAHDRPEDVIVREARRVRADLIVMGVKERSAAAPAFGPTAEVILRESPCSVLLLST